MVVALACGQPKLPAPKYTQQPTAALSEVPYPPPPARAESVPKQPQGGTVWIDGEWLWQTRRWSWKPGRWVSPPAGARFAPWTTVRDRTGTLYMAAGAWRDAHGAEVTEPPPLAEGAPGAGTIITPEGDTVLQGPITPPAGPTGNGREDLDAAAERATIELDASRTSAQDGGTMPRDAPRMETP